MSAVWTGSGRYPAIRTFRSETVEETVNEGEKAWLFPRNHGYPHRGMSGQRGFGQGLETRLRNTRVPCSAD